PLTIATFVLTVVGLALGVGLIPLALVGVPVLALTLIVCGAFGRLERARVALLLGDEIAPPPRRPPSGPGKVARLLTVLRGTSRWREVAAPVVGLPVVTIGFALAVSAWALALAFVTLPAYNSSLPRGGAEAFGHVYRSAPTMVASVVIG